MDWFKTWSNGILRGSLCQVDDSSQLIWIKLLAVANETHVRNGRLEFKKGSPMSRIYLANYINTSLLKLNRAIQLFENDFDYTTSTTRITIEQDGTIVINKWDYYQNDRRELPKKEPMSQEKKRGMQRSINNQYPHNAIEDLKQGFGHTIVDKNGEVM